MENFITPDVFLRIAKYLNEQTENYYLSIHPKGFKSPIEVEDVQIPTIFDDVESLASLKENGFLNPYQMLNSFLTKFNVANVPEDQELYFNYLKISLLSEPMQHQRSMIRKLPLNFMVDLLMTPEQTFTFIIQYNFGEINSCEAENFAKAEALDYANPDTPEQEYALLRLNSALEALNNFVVQGIIDLPGKATETDIIRFVEILRGSKRLTFPQAKEILRNIQNNSYGSSLAALIPVFVSDWKFDPEDAEFFVSELLGETFKFNYPDNCYSHDLFPYINQELSKSNYELLSFETDADFYEFVIVKKENLPELMVIAEKLAIEIVHL